MHTFLDIIVRKTLLQMNVKRMHRHAIDSNSYWLHIFLLTLCSGISIESVSPTDNAVSDVQHFAVFAILYPPVKIYNNYALDLHQ